MEQKYINQNGGIESLLADLEKVSVMVGFERYSIIGNTYYRAEQRFLDMLNKNIVIGGQPVAEFIVVTQGLLISPDGKKERIAGPCFINKDSIIFVGAFDETRSTTSQKVNKVKGYPWTEKNRTSVEVYCDDKYRLSGNLHADPKILPASYIESQKRFLPMTDVRVTSLMAPSEISFDFLAVNRKRISMFTFTQAAGE